MRAAMEMFAGARRPWVRTFALATNSKDQRPIGRAFERPSCGIQRRERRACGNHPTRAERDSASLRFGTNAPECGAAASTPPRAATSQMTRPCPEPCPELSTTDRR
jgi:hypothetical protein